MPEKSGHERSEGSPKHDEFPSAQILKVSKIIHAEAITFLYSHNTFTNVSVEDKDHIYDFREDPRDFQSGFSRYFGRPIGQQLSAIWSTLLADYSNFTHRSFQCGCWARMVHKIVLSKILRIG